MTARSPAWIWAVCGLLLLATMLNYVDRQTLSQMAMDIGRELRLSNEGYGKLERGFGLAFTAGGNVTGFLVDRLGVRLFYPAPVLAWSAAGFTTAWANSLTSLLACRNPIGFGGIGLFPVYYSLSQEPSAPHKGKVTDTLICIGWLVTALMQWLVGLSMDRTGSCELSTFPAGLVPLAGFAALLLYWDHPARRSPTPRGRSGLKPHTEYLTYDLPTSMGSARGDDGTRRAEAWPRIGPSCIVSVETGSSH